LIEGDNVEQRKINPWKWQDQYGFSQGIEVTNAGRVLYCAGQASVDENGKPLHVGDMRKQIDQAFRNLEAVL
jgi:enamine deaminase RidA (YjgF/YER057c/UK114 family)